MSHRPWIPMMLLGGMLIAAGARAADSSRSAIEAADAAFEAAVTRADAAAIAAMYDAHAAVMPAGSEPVRGREAIEKFWQTTLKSIPGVSLGLRTTEVYGRAPTLTEVGEYEIKDGSGKLIDHGKYIVIWRHESSAWKLLRDMFSTNVPPPKT